MIMINPKISVILPTHNRSELLPRTIHSLLNQTYQDFEIIIIDDASQDNTPDIIQGMVKTDPRIRSIRSDENIGPGAARNLGVEQARGEFIAIIDDDDIALPQRLQKQLFEFEIDQQIDLVFSCVEWVDEVLNSLTIFPGIVQRDEFPNEPGEVFKLLYLEGNKIPNTTLLTRKEIWDMSMYPSEPWIGEDWLFFMKLAALSIRMKAIPEVLVQQSRGQNRQGLMDVSIQKGSQAQRKVLELIKTWLAEQNILAYDHLHKLALSNQIIRESRHFIGIRGLGMLLKAFFIAPGNPKVTEQFHWYCKKVYQKVRRGKIT